MSTQTPIVAENAFPRPPLIAAAVMIALVLTGAAASRLMGLSGGEKAALPSGVPAAMRDVRFVDRDDGGIDVSDAADDRVFEAYAPGADGFVRATLRGLARDRRNAGLGPETPFRVARFGDGRIVLEDPALERRIDLRAFGATNAASFARLLPRDTIAMGEAK
jgi:putative photosynthetic complex assembly protein